MKFTFRIQFIMLLCLSITDLEVFSQHFVITHSGDSIHGVKLVYDTPIAQSAFFTLNDKRFNANDVAFIRNNNGTFANLNKIYGLDTEHYALRIKTGRANAFEEIPFGIYSGDTLKVYPGMRGINKLLASGKRFDFYNIGQGPVYAANYKNMIRDMGGNSESKWYIEHYRKLSRIQIVLATAGVGIMTYEFIRAGKLDFTPIAALGAT
ncbi:MAG: hypothetical protein ACKO8Q_08760, partial [Bacteroidota bacterium]